MMKHCRVSPRIALLAALAIATAAVPPAARGQQAQAQAGQMTPGQITPVGDWRTFDDKTGRERGLVRIQEQGGTLTGHIIATTDPAEGRHVCERCGGDLKNRPILGLTIMSGLHRDGDEWDGGHIVDPETGSVYRCAIRLEDGGSKLVVRGYLGLSLFGRSQHWVRAR
jgi:uncharacterized protein (DUF2147 family)